ncbi:MAG TPA: hypothetical protein VML94_05865 [Thermoplasmata archaeon]|nr:hypothetical protein [Thermoplasmata archaeon]
MIHRDRYDPGENPVGHFFVDAPELPFATGAAVAAGALTFHYLDKKEKEKPDGDQRWWFPALLALGAAAIAFIIVYILAALIRVSLGVG